MLPSNRFRTFVLQALLLLQAVCLFPGQVRATHSMGADLTYQCLGGNNYKLRLSFYRDCSGADAPFNVDIRIRSVSCGFDYFEIASPIPGTGQEITPICDSELSTCNGGVVTGIQEWIYEADITLPAQCSDWTFSYELCCRNQAITNINNPLAENINVFSTLNNLNGICNNSPTFINKPVPFICAGQQFCFNHGSNDADGDSLVYSLITPRTSDTTQVFYFSPYSPSQPLNSVPAMTFDPVTGDFCLTPQSLEVTVMAVLVSEYRNGVLIGQVERDLQITVLNCANTLPTLTGINGTNSFSAIACAGAPFCFDVFSSDPDAVQNVTVTWDGAIGGAAFTSNGAGRPTGTFCWTPMPWNVSTIPHCFTIMVQDDACPYEASQVFSYCITVVDLDVDAGSDQSIGCNDQTTLTAVVNSPLPVTYNWNTGATSASINAATGTYVVTASSGLCAARDSVTVHSSTAPTAFFSAPLTCANTPVQFTNLSFGNVPISSWNWSFGDGATSGLPSPAHTYAGPGIYQAMLIVDAAGCRDTVIIPVTVNSPPLAGATVTPACPGSTVSIANTSSGSGLNYNWSSGAGQSSGLAVPLFTYPAAGTYTLSLEVTDTLGCTDDTLLTVGIPARPDPGFAFGPGPVCANSPVQFSDTTSGSIQSRNWDFGNGISSALQMPMVSFMPGTYSVELTITNASGCTDSVSVQLFVPAEFIAPPVPGTTVCAGNPVTLNATMGTSYLWSTGQTSASINISPQITSLYTVTVTDINGCTDTAAVIVNVFPLPVANAGADQEICKGDSVTFTATGGGNYLWSGGATTAIVTLFPLSDTQTTVTVTSTDGCTDTDTVQVVVNALPQADFSANNSCISNPVICNNLSAGNAPFIYSWDFGDGTVAGNIVNPQHQYSAAGNFPVTLVVTDQKGCVDSLTRSVRVVDDPVVNLSAVPLPGCDSTTTLYSFAANSTLVSWNWQFYNGSLNGDLNPEVTYYSSGNYSVSFSCITAEGCSASAVITSPVEVYGVPEAAFVISPDPKPFLPVFFTNYSTGANAYAWELGDGTLSFQENPQHVYNDTGIFVVRLVAMNDYGCSDTALREFSIPPAWICFVPNAFTPNDDGVNDLFNLKGKGISDITLSIYNRWGDKVFSALNTGWDGRDEKGEIAKEDVYIYRFGFTDPEGNSHERTGRVSLVR